MIFFKKRFFTLIEVLISISLFSIIITLLFSYFVKITKLEKRMDGMKKEFFLKNRANIKLNYIFTQIKSKDLLENPRLYTEYEKNSNMLTLRVLFDNGIDFDPNFSNLQTAKIYVDDKKNLILDVFSEKTEKPRREILLKDVYSIEYQFLSREDEKMKKTQKKEIAKNIFWYYFWPKENSDVPSIVKMTVNKDLKFVFFLPTKKDIVYYSKANK